MQKIISLFQRNYGGDYKVRDEVVPGAEWVLAGEGVATRKYDGTSCLVQDGQLFKRYDAKQGKTPPAAFVPAQPEPDPVSGHWPGWVPVSDTDPADQWHREAWAAKPSWADGTYELCGPKVRDNAEHLRAHMLIAHGADVLADCPRTYEALRGYLQGRTHEGVVWHHPDGRMVKIKAKDFPS